MFKAPMGQFGRMKMSRMMAECRISLSKTHARDNATFSTAWFDTRFRRSFSLGATLGRSGRLSASRLTVAAFIPGALYARPSVSPGCHHLDGDYSSLQKMEETHAS
jgi:hypothetical protein